MASVFVFDPTAADNQSAVRGIGRYLQVLKENFPDWIFTNQIRKIDPKKTFINPFFDFLKPPLTIKRIARKQIAIIHDLIPLKYPVHFPIGLKAKANIFLNKIALGNYDAIITDSEASRQDIITIMKIPPAKVKVIYPSLPKIFTTDKQSPIPPQPQSPFCLYVGDATWNKNLVNLARALKIINVSCIFAGNVFTKKHKNLNHPWQKELKFFLEETEGDKRFIFPGFVSDKKLIKLYRQARLNLLVSRDEGFGFSYLEAASQGTPSVLANIPVFHEIAGNSALFADPEDPNAIADQIGRLYFNPRLRNKLSQAAKIRSDIFKV